MRTRAADSRASSENRRKGKIGRLKRRRRANNVSPCYPTPQKQQTSKDRELSAMQSKLEEANARAVAAEKQCALLLAQVADLKRKEHNSSRPEKRMKAAKTGVVTNSKAVPLHRVEQITAAKKRGPKQTSPEPSADQAAESV